MEAQELSSDDGPTPGTDEWLQERIFCRCMRCKHQIKRQRRIAMQHVQEYGEMRRSELHIPEEGSQDDIDLTRVHQFDSAPHVSVQCKRLRRAYEDIRRQQEQDAFHQNPQDTEFAPDLVDEGMEEMVQTFLGSSTREEHDEEEFSNEERMMRKFALIQRGPTPEPLCQVMLRVGDLNRSISSYEKVSDFVIIWQLMLFGEVLPCHVVHELKDPPIEEEEFNKRVSGFRFCDYMAAYAVWGSSTMSYGMRAKDHPFEEEEYNKRVSGFLIIT